METAGLVLSGEMSAEQARAALMSRPVKAEAGEKPA